MERLESVGVIIVAAGKGLRMGVDIPKQYLPIDGEPMVFRTLERFLRPDISRIILAADEDNLAYCREQIRERYHGIAPKVEVTAGGATRAESVQRGLAELGQTCRYVLVHDGARPFVSPEVISRVLEGVKKTGACVPVVTPADTVRDDEHTLDRSGLHLVQTPQGFRTDILAMAYEDAKGSRFEGTDDASYVEQLGVTVSMVEGDPANRKMTTKEDMPMQVRAGTGFDVHRFGEAAEDSVITIGGVKIPYERPLLAHSDGDVLTHAIMDAVLGACGLGDIGEAFPDTDPAYEGADSVGLLRTCGEMIREKGYVVSNIDATIIGQEPKFMPYKRDMEKILAEALGLPADRINIKATTTEKLGFTGRKEGLAAEAVCLVKGV